MAGSIDLLIALAFGVGALVILWRSRRKLSTVGRLKNVTVSRQWLIEHQSDE